MTLKKFCFWGKKYTKTGRKMTLSSWNPKIWTEVSQPQGFPQGMRLDRENEVEVTVKCHFVHNSPPFSERNQMFLIILPVGVHKSFNWVPSMRSGKILNSYHPNHGAGSISFEKETLARVIPAREAGARKLTVNDTQTTVEFNKAPSFYRSQEQAYGKWGNSFVRECGSPPAV